MRDPMHPATKATALSQPRTARHRSPSLPHKARDSGALHLAVPEAWLQAAWGWLRSWGCRVHRPVLTATVRGAPFVACDSGPDGRLRLAHVVAAGHGGSLRGDAGVGFGAKLAIGSRNARRAPRRAAAGAFLSATPVCPGLASHTSLSLHMRTARQRA